MPIKLTINIIIQLNDVFFHHAKLLVKDLTTVNEVDLFHKFKHKL